MIKTCPNCTEDFDAGYCSWKVCCSQTCSGQYNKIRINISLRFQVLDRDGFKCWYCGDSPRSNEDCRLEADHVIPRSRGGANTMYNLITACRTCNLGKKAKMLAENNLDQLQDYIRTVTRPII